MQISPGFSIGEFRVIRKLGEGSFSIVVEAEDLRARRRVALKLPKRRCDFSRIASFRAPPSHPGIVATLAVRKMGAIPYAVEELVRGCTLRDIVRRHPQGLPLGDIETAFRAIVLPLAHVHAQGLVHGDLKPENVLLPEGDLARAKLADFEGSPDTKGLANSLVSGTATKAATAIYLAPERARGAPATASGDCYALGAMLFELATGRLPQGVDLPSEVRPELPAWVDRVFARTHTGKERRAAHAGEVLALFEPALAHGAARPGRRAAVRKVAIALIFGAGAIALLRAAASPERSRAEALRGRRAAAVRGIESRLRTAMRERESLAAECERLKTELARRRAAEFDFAACKREAEASEARIAALVSRVDRLRAIEAEAEALEARLRKAEVERAAMRVEAEIWRGRFDLVARENARLSADLDRLAAATPPQQEKPERCATCRGGRRIACERCPRCAACDRGAVPCARCRGEGLRLCGVCGGSGRLMQRRQVIFVGAGGGSSFETLVLSCKACSGRGSVRCSTCGGKGQKKCATCSGTGLSRACPECAGSRRRPCPACGGAGAIRSGAGAARGGDQPRKSG